MPGYHFGPSGEGPFGSMSCEIGGAMASTAEGRQRRERQGYRENVEIARRMERDDAAAKRARHLEEQKPSSSVSSSQGPASGAVAASPSSPSAEPSSGIVRKRYDSEGDPLSDSMRKLKKGGPEPRGKRGSWMIRKMARGFKIGVWSQIWICRI